MNNFDLYNFVSSKHSPRSKIFLPLNLISFLEQGEKLVYYADKKITITDNQFVLLSSGNYLMTEKISVNNNYRSTMLFFEDNELVKFFVKYADIVDQISLKTDTTEMPLAVFEKDEFIRSYITTLKLIQLKPLTFTDRMLQLKFEELMLHLLEKYPNEILAFRAKKLEKYSDFEIRKTVELNITNNLTIKEMAFLCHMSASTFKRKFIKIYNQPPSQYFLYQKMELAKSLLLKKENPSEVFYKVGYESHSSFSKAFKQVYGSSPKEFQLQNMTLSQ